MSCLTQKTRSAGVLSSTTARSAIHRREYDMKERMRIAALLIAAMAAGYVGGLMSHANSGIVRARKFTLVDAAGKTRGIFTTTKGDPALCLVDVAGTTRRVFCAINGETALTLFDAQGRIRGSFSTVRGQADLSLDDATGTTRGVFFTSKDGEPTLALCDARGKIRGAFTTKDGKPELLLWDVKGKGIWQAP